MAYHFPILRDLVRVIPVAQSQTRDDTTLTILSIDCYTDGWTVHLRIHHPNPYLYPMFGTRGFYPTTNTGDAVYFRLGHCNGPWRYHDDDPNAYFSYTWSPALDIDSIALGFFARVIRFIDRPRDGVLVAEAWGPWRFSVDLSAGSVATAQEATESAWGPLNWEKRAEVRKDFGKQPLPPAVDILLDIFYKYDPYGIAWLDPSGPLWYEEMAIAILRGLPFAHSEADVGAIILHELEEFSLRWGGTRFRRHRRDRFAEMVTEAWEAWQQARGDTPAVSTA